MTEIWEMHSTSNLYYLYNRIIIIAYYSLYYYWIGFMYISLDICQTMVYCYSDTNIRLSNDE